MDTEMTPATQIEKIDQTIDGLLGLRSKLTKGETDKITFLCFACDEKTNKCSITLSGSGMHVVKLISSVMQRDNDIRALITESLRYLKRIEV